jgi:ABC-type molybdenum transport system ATPase subunit/photorepair protein PhrA
VTEFNTTTGSVVRVINGKYPDFESPQAIAFSGGEAFVTGAGVIEFNTNTGVVVRRIKAKSYEFSSPTDIVISGAHAFVTNTGAQSVTEFNTVTGALVHVLH